MTKKSVLILLCLLFAFVQWATAARQPAFYLRWQKLPSDTLLKMGNVFVDRAGAPDSALACFTIVANRSSEKLSEEGRRQCTRGYIGKWYVYFFHFFDYYKAYESLCSAQTLAEGFDRETTRVLLNFGCMYQAIAEQTQDQHTLQKAYDYFRRCFTLALKSHNTDVDMAFANLITVSYDMGKLSSIRKEWAQYRELPLLAKDSVRIYNHLFYEGKLLMSQGKYVEAEKKFDTVISKSDESLGLMRFRCVGYIYKAEALAARHDYSAAVASLHQALSLSQRHNLKDAVLEICDKLSHYYALMGNKESSLLYRGQYLQLKDTVLNYQQLMKVNEMRFVNSMKKVDEQMQQVRHRQQVERIVSLAVFVIALLIAIFLWIVWHKNRRLSKQNVMLYERTVEMIKKEEDEQRRRKSLEDELEQYKQKDSQKKEKYQYNNLDEADKARLCEQILAVMENSPEILSSDFTAERLAQMVGSKYKYVSHVINETYGCNFSTFINEYRIKEACRRIGDREHYGNLTIEAIAHEVGFKSRTTFIASFKKVTGLTPSEYIKISLSR